MLLNYARYGLGVFFGRCFKSIKLMSPQFLGCPIFQLTNCQFLFLDTITNAAQNVAKWVQNRLNTEGNLSNAASRDENAASLLTDWKGGEGSQRNWKMQPENLWDSRHKKARLTTIWKLTVVSKRQHSPRMCDHREWSTDIYIRYHYCY